MKRLFLIIMLALCAGIINAQTNVSARTKISINPERADSLKKTDSVVKVNAGEVATKNKDFTRTAANLKSGTSQDVLTSFFKLAFSDLQDGRHFQFNSSLFAVKAKTDTTLWIDSKYKKQVFARNLTFGIDYGLDSNYKFKTTSVNIKYALINNRDKSIFDYQYGRKFALVMDTAFNLFNTALNIYITEYRAKRKSDSERVLKYVQQADTTFAKKPDIPGRFTTILQALSQTKEFSSGTVDQYKKTHDIAIIEAAKAQVNKKISDNLTIKLCCCDDGIADKAVSEELVKRIVRISDSLIHPKVAAPVMLADVFFAKALATYSKEDSLNYKRDANLVNHFFFDAKPETKTAAADLPARYISILDSLVQLNQFISLGSGKYLTIRDSINNMYKSAAALLAQQSLWTLGGQITADKNKLISKTTFSSEYLKGITKNNTSMGLELDIKANLSTYDSTIVSTAYHRNVFAASAGINWIIYKDKSTQKSYVEFKPALAYNNVLSGLYANETKSRFTADGVLRFRITDDLWISIDIKYDPKAGKVFGFLNITSNFDWLGAKSKTSVAN